MLSEGDTGDDDSEEEEERGADAVVDKAGRVSSSAFDDALAVDAATGDVAWGRLLDGGSSGRQDTGAESSRRCCKTMLPLGLLIFLLPALLLAPFYIVVYTSTVAALNNVIEAQARGFCCRLHFLHLFLRLLHTRPPSPPGKRNAGPITGHVYYGNAACRDISRNNDGPLWVTRPSGIFFASFGAHAALAVCRAARVTELHPPQTIVGSAWATLVDIRAKDSNLLYLSNGIGAPIGTNTADPLDTANPLPAEFEVPLKKTELDGVAGVPAATTAQIYAGFLQDGCPFLMSFDETMTLAECRSIAGGALSFGIRKALKDYIAMATRLLQAKQDFMDRINIASPVVPIVTATGEGYNLSELMSSPDFITLRKLGTRGMWPAYEHVVSGPHTHTPPPPPAHPHPPLRLLGSSVCRSSARALRPASELHRGLHRRIHCFCLGAYLIAFLAPHRVSQPRAAPASHDSLAAATAAHRRSAVCTRHHHRRSRRVR